MIDVAVAHEERKDLKMFGFFTLAMACMVLLVG